MTERPEQFHYGWETIGNADNRVTIARIARPHGNRGEVIANLLTDFPERFARLKNVYIEYSGGEIRNLELEKSRPHKGRVVLKFRGYDDINRAEELRNARVIVTDDQLVELPEGSYYNFDLVDCEVTTTEGRQLGHVADVQDYGAAPLLVVRAGERELLIPLALSICVEIDVARKRIVVNPPEGLLEL